MALLVLATTNRKKASELRSLLAPLGLIVKTLTDYADHAEVVEDGATFADNARLKATQQALRLGEWSLGEDSGIAVDALGGAPGIFSARFSGEAATDDSNNRLLIERLRDVPTQQRGAQYVCHLALADPAGRIHAEADAACHGCIAAAPRGSAGFGYDPLFEIPEYHRTIGELGPAVKGAISHRRRAIEQFLPAAARLIAVGGWT